MKWLNKTLHKAFYEDCGTIAIYTDKGEETHHNPVCRHLNIYRQHFSWTKSASGIIRD